jgi:hypothetical protein
MENKVRPHIVIIVNYFCVKRILLTAPIYEKERVWHVKCAILYYLVNDMFLTLQKTIYEFLIKFDHNIKISSYFSNLLFEY